MNVLYHLAAQREALVILIKKTHCTSAQRLVLLDYQLAGFSLNRKHGLATFVHERLKWTLSTNIHLHRSLNGCASTLMDIRQSTFTNLHRFVCKNPISRYSHIPVSMLATLIASMSLGFMMPTVQIENAWLAGQISAILPYFIIQRMPPTSTLVAGIQVTTRIFHLSVSIWTVVYQTDMS